jgi:dsDNA-binding SOS-regulon protein
VPDKKKIADLHFMDARSKMLDLAAFFDRMDRHIGDADFRDKALRRALPILLESRKDRVATILNSLSDESLELSEKAPFQGAFGAPTSTKGGNS